MAVFIKSNDYCKTAVIKTLFYISKYLIGGFKRLGQKIKELA
jgi:hypothetical protein